MPTIDSILNIVMPVGIFGFIFYLIYDKVPVFKLFVNKVIDIAKNGFDGASSPGSGPAEYTREIRYG